MDAHYSCNECYPKHDPCETCWVQIDEGTHPQQPQNIKTESRPTMSYTIQGHYPFLGTYHETTEGTTLRCEYTIYNDPEKGQCDTVSEQDSEMVVVLPTGKVVSLTTEELSALNKSVMKFFEALTDTSIDIRIAYLESCIEQEEYEKAKVQKAELLREIADGELNTKYPEVEQAIAEEFTRLNKIIDQGETK